MGTAALLKYLHEEFDKEGNIEFYFCMGSDAFIDFAEGKWKESGRIKQLLQGRFIVLHRQQEGVNEDRQGLLEQRVRETPGAVILDLCTIQLTDVSSTQVRECRDQSLLAKLTLPSVVEYMKQNSMYQFAAGGD